MPYFKITGNPFVDLGVFSLLAWSGKDLPEQVEREDVERLSRNVRRLPVSKEWRNFLYNVFANRGGISAPKQANIRYWDNKICELLESLAPLQESGNCMACGSRDVDGGNELYRNYIPLTGTGEFLNFFPAATKRGADYCSTCILTITLGIVGLSSLQKLPFFLYSSSLAINKAWAEMMVEHLQRVIAGIVKGPDGYSEGVNNQVNAIFRICNQLAKNNGIVGKDDVPSLVFFAYKNYNQLPANPLTIKQFPPEVFSFLCFANHAYPKEWKAIVDRGYKLKKKEEAVGVNTYNWVYENLFADKSINRAFFDVRQRKLHAPWELFAAYLQEVSNVTEEQLRVIQKLADDISYQIQIKKEKWLVNLEMANDVNDFRNVLVKFARNQHQTKLESPLLDEEVYFNLLFPDEHRDWRRVRDMLLFGLYSRLHDWLQEQNLPELSDTELKEALE